MGVVHDYTQIDVNYPEIARVKLGITSVDVAPLISAETKARKEADSTETSQRISADATERNDRIAADAALALRVLPAGGTVGQSLTKASDADYDAEWSTFSLAPHATTHENGGTDEISVAGLSGLLADAQTPTAHATSHQNGGSDEISVAGLSGLLADSQTPLAHAASHQNGGGDEINVAGLNGLLADGQTPLAHATSHQNGGSDEISVAGLSGLLADDQTPLVHDIITKHTFPGGSTFLRADGTFATPADTGITQLTGDVTAGPGSGSLTATIAADAVTNAKLSDMAANSIKGNNTGGAANPVDLTATQATAMLNPFTSLLQGLVPASGGGTTNFLRADGNWATPSIAAAWPIGSVFISVVSTNPGTLLGFGTWVAFGAGRVLVGLDALDPDFDTVEETGGAKTVTLATAEMPAHTHVQDAHNHTQNSHTHIQDSHNHTQDAHTHVQNSHNHTQDTHTHVQDSHNHTQDAHTHVQTSHNHTQDTHTHVQNSHNHTQDAHTHGFTNLRGLATGVATTNMAVTEAADTSSTATTLLTAATTATNQAATAVNQNTIATNQATTAVNNNATATNQATTATNQNTVATNQSATAVNQNATATNQAATATNQVATATNIAATATNQNTGGGGAHSNLQPYLVCYFFKRVS